MKFQTGKLYVKNAMRRKIITMRDFMPWPGDKMSWIEAHQAVGRHGKTMLLSRRLAIPRAQAIGHLMSLWWWALDSCGRSGSLARYSAEAIADGAGWDDEASGANTESPSGNALDFYAALVECGWVDHDGDITDKACDPVGGKSSIHDWEQYSERYFDLETKKAMDREAGKIRVAKFREKHREEDGNARGNMDVTRYGNGHKGQCNAPTGPDRTGPTEPKEKSGCAKNAHVVIQSVWNELAHGCLPRCKEVGSGERLEAMKARWSEHPDEAYWRKTVNNMNAQTFCLGENDRRWMANMDFLLRPESSIKINEGAYLKPEEARKFKCCGRCKREGSWIKGPSKNGKTSLCADCLKKENESEVKDEQPKETTPCQPSKET